MCDEIAQERMYFYEKALDLHKAGLSLGSISKKIGVPKGTIWNWVSGKRHPLGDRNKYPFRDFKIPDLDLTPESSYVLGTILGDGNLYHHPNPKRGAYLLRLRVINREFAQRFAEALMKLTKKTLKVKLGKHKATKKGFIFRVVCYSKRWYYIFKKAVENIENLVAHMTDASLKSFIRGFVDSEGSIYEEPRITISNTNKLYQKLIYQALQRLHYHPTINTYPKTGGRKDEIVIALHRINEVKRYLNEIGFSDRKKQEKGDKAILKKARYFRYQALHDNALKLHKEGFKVTQISKKLQIPLATTYYWIKG